MADDMIIDLTNFRDRVGTRVAPGTYRIQVEDVEQTKSNAGNSMIVLFLRVMGGEYDGATLVDRLTLTDAAMFRVVNFMQAIGMPTPRKRLKVQPQRFKGQTLDVEVDDGDPFRGVVRSEVRTYLKVAGKGKAAEDDLEDPDARWDDEDEDTGVEEAGTNDVAANEAPDPNVTTEAVADLDEVDLDSLEV